MAEHNKLGKKGEALAAKHLSEQGFQIIERNWQHEKDEIDLIALDGKELVIVEVKTRSTDFFGNPEDAVDKRKQQFLIRAAEAFVEEKDIFKEIRYDIVAVIIEPNTTRIKHIRDAFYPELED